MKQEQLSLDRLCIGQNCRVAGLDAVGTQRRRMLDLGLVEGTNVEALHKSPSGDPVAYFIRGAVIALRGEDAKKVRIELEE
ncbi:MAG TPA: ferrous iron transport protein A [Candidatus Aphodoplasma excrementigallinarum]|uniref:Ferrous iron transport protein A n=1 Tax=Candidatus Aphodoplasma excrementigallinarum TaxID=2840673 RepID=A0A9D1NHV5_9FIRM|nr:ferrous iron transport protein A [Candidatus Aphodoplasma excrementigallinarum]